MRVSSLSTVLIAALGFASSSDALKILMGNDDGFGSGNIRELYKLLVDAGHEGTYQAALFMTSQLTNIQSSSLRPHSSSLAKAEQSSGPNQPTSRFPHSTTSFLLDPRL